MKAKNKRLWLQQKQNWFDKLPKSEKASRQRPGSVKSK